MMQTHKLPLTKHIDLFNGLERLKKRVQEFDSIKSISLIQRKLEPFVSDVEDLSHDLHIKYALKDENGVLQKGSDGNYLMISENAIKLKEELRSLLKEKKEVELPTLPPNKEIKALANEFHYILFEVYPDFPIDQEKKQ